LKKIGKKLSKQAARRICGGRTFGESSLPRTFIKVEKSARKTKGSEAFLEAV
jgi:hypothetical protein